MKKSLRTIIILTIILALLIPYSISYGTDSSSEFFEVTSDEITVSDVIEGSIIIENMPYDKFIFALESDFDISSTEIVEDNTETNITVESENEIKFEFDKSSSTLSKIILQCALPDDVEVGDTITLVATVTNSENEEEFESIEITITIIEETISAESTENTETNVSSETVGSGYLSDYSESSTYSNFESSSDVSNFDMSSMSSEYSNNSNFDTSSLASSLDASSINSTSLSVSDISSVLTEEATYNGSDDNYLSELSVDSYSLNKSFSKESTTYFVSVSSDVDSLDITATAEDDGATVCIYGNDDLQSGENKILITVTAENGNTRTYRIYVTKD